MDLVDKDNIHEKFITLVAIYPDGLKVKYANNTL